MFQPAQLEIKGTDKLKGLTIPTVGMKQFLMNTECSKENTRKITCTCTCSIGVGTMGAMAAAAPIKFAISIYRGIYSARTVQCMLH